MDIQIVLIMFRCVLRARVKRVPLVGVALVTGRCPSEPTYELLRVG